MLSEAIIWSESKDFWVGYIIYRIREKDAFSDEIMKPEDADYRLCKTCYLFLSAR